MIEKKSLYYDWRIHVRFLAEFRPPESLGRSGSTGTRPGLLENHVPLSPTFLSPWRLRSEIMMDRKFVRQGNLF